MADGALLLFDAFDAAAAIWRALLVWIVVGAAAATAVVLGTVALLVWLVRRTWQAVTRGTAAPLAAGQVPQATEPLPTLHEPPTPTRALTDKEAA